MITIYSRLHSFCVCAVNVDGVGQGVGYPSRAAEPELFQFKANQGSREKIGF